MRLSVCSSRLPLLLLAALGFAIAFGVFAPSAVAQMAPDESNPAVFWRLEREREEALRRRSVIIQRPTRMTRGVAPRLGYTRRVPAGSAAANAAANAQGAETSGAEPAGAAAPAKTAEAPAAAAPEGPPFVIGVLGDNVAQMLALGLNEAYADKNVSIVRLARENTGLVRDDYFDWPKAVRELLASDRKIDLAVMMIGSNDRQPIRADGKTHDVLSDGWTEIYRARALAIAEAFRDKGIPLIWVGMTVMKNERLSNDVARFNEIYRAAAQKAGASFVDVWEPFVDERNRFALSGPDINGHVTRIRTGDGVHFTRAGSRKLAHFVEADVKRFLDRRTAPALANTPDATQQNAALGSPPPAGETGGEAANPGVAPGLLPAIEPPAPVRPVAGPVMPLTARALSPGGELASRTGVASGEKGVLDGLPPEARAGRADDFSWPRQ